VLELINRLLGIGLPPLWVWPKPGTHNWCDYAESLPCDTDKPPDPSPACLRDAVAQSSNGSRTLVALLPSSLEPSRWWQRSPCGG